MYSIYTNICNVYLYMYIAELALLGFVAPHGEFPQCSLDVGGCRTDMSLCGTLPR